MKLKPLLPHLTTALVLAACVLTTSTSANADVIAWTTWTSAIASNPSPGSATGTLAGSNGPIAISYSGQTNGISSYPSFGPNGTFTGGTVGNAPPAANGSVAIMGGQSYTETVTFSSAITDPLFAIFSLGQPGITGSFDFSPTELFTVQTGGPSSDLGGTALIVNGTQVSGQEANGIIQFVGTYTSLTFTTPNLEDYYTFTIGEDETRATQLAAAPTLSAIPEPATLSLFSIGIAALHLTRRTLTRNH